MSLSNDNHAPTTNGFGAFHTVDPANLITAAPAGWSTIATWWAVEEPYALELMVDPLATLREEDARMRTLIAAREVPEVLVRACSALAAVGVEYERAYPDVLLARRYPADL